MMIEETEGVFDFETNGTDKGFRLPHQLAVIDLNNLDNLSISALILPLIIWIYAIISVSIILATIPKL